MKHFAALILVACFLCGCSPEKSQVGSMTWYQGATNCQLSVIVNQAVVTTNIDSLEAAANVLGQYGWQVVTVANENGSRVFYLKRQYQGNDSSSFALTPDFLMSPGKSQP